MITCNLQVTHNYLPINTPQTEKVEYFVQLAVVGDG